MFFCVLRRLVMCMKNLSFLKVVLLALVVSFFLSSLAVDVHSANWSWVRIPGLTASIFLGIFLWLIHLTVGPWEPKG